VVWYGNNDQHNAKSPFPPSPKDLTWGKQIPTQLLPSILETKLDVAQVEGTEFLDTAPVDQPIKPEKQSTPLSDEIESLSESPHMEENSISKGDFQKAHREKEIKVEVDSGIDKMHLDRTYHSQKTVHTGDRRQEFVGFSYQTDKSEANKEKTIRRKLTAILSADVKGYSTLMEENEILTVQTLVDYRKIMTDLIRQFRGRVVDSPGDNLLAEFISVVDAVQCAVEIQQVLRAKNDLLSENRRMEFRIGVNLGDVIEEADRIYGEGVNIASRVEGMADPGGICISGSAYEQIENKLPLNYVYMGEHRVKNIRKPIKIYRAQINGDRFPKAAFSAKSAKRIKQASIGVISILFVIAGLFVWKYFLHPPTSGTDGSPGKKVSPMVAPKGAESTTNHTLQPPQISALPISKPDQQPPVITPRKPATTASDGSAATENQQLLQEFSKKLPTISSETYFFATREKALRNAKLIAFTMVETNSDSLKKSFEEKGLKIAKIPELEIERALETLIVDGVITTSKALVEKLRRNFPQGIAIRLYPVFGLLEEKSQADVLQGLIFADRVEVDFSPDWDPDIWGWGKIVDRHTKEQHLASLSSWGDGKFKKNVDRDIGQTSDIRIFFKNVFYLDDFYVVICPPKSGGFYHGKWFAGDKLFLDRGTSPSHNFREPECFRIARNAIDPEKQVVIHARGFIALYVNIAEILLSDRVLSPQDMENLFSSN
jgi:class 3 adenylate cyclase